MRAPAGLVAAALLLWGWSIGQLVLGIVLAVAYEVSRLATPSAAVARRMSLVVRACALAVLALLGYVVATQSLPNSLYTWLRWLPLVLLPIPALAQLAGGVTLGTFVQASGRKRESAEDDDPAIDTTHAYAAITLAAAGTGIGAMGWLYAGYAAIVGWALLARLPRSRLAGAAVMFVAAAAFGHAVHTGIWLLQGQVEDWSTEFFQALFAGKPDPFRERTRIGELGRIKLSDRILMRVEVEGARPSSILLREAAFERYSNGEWQNVRPKPRAVLWQGDQWVLSKSPATHRLSVRRSFPEGEGLLPLPLGTRTIAHLPAQIVETFPSGAARVRGAHRFAAFTTAYDPAGETDPPDARDLVVPASLAVVLERTIAASGLRREAPAATVRSVRAFFDTGYAYSLDLGDRARTLSDFLTTDRKGHCEYFASGTVMLLRSLGVPARYAAGYSVQEYSALERAFVVRNRHAHAWAQAYVDGRWIEVDTTPARWADLEGEAARGFLAPILDAISWAVEEVVRAWIGTDEGARGLAMALVLVAAVLAVLAILALRRWRKRGSSARARPDSIARAWREVEARLGRMGYRRGESETVRAWVRRLTGDSAAASWSPSLDALAADYYRVRYDPAAPAADAARFVDAARRWAKA